MHDLDTCEVTVEGEELNGEQESLEVDAARLQQKGIEMSSSDVGVVFTGGKSDSWELSSQLKTWKEPWRGREGSVLTGPMAQALQ